MGMLLAKNGFYNEAKTEIEKVIAIRHENGWRIPSEIIDITDNPWYKTATKYKDNRAFYNKYLSIAEEVLYHNIPEEVVVVEFVNYHKHFLNFIKDETKHGFLKYAGLVEEVSIGDVLSIRFDGKGQDKFYKALTIKKLSEDTENKAVRPFQGVVRINKPAGFGFVDNIFIEPKLIESFDLVQGQQVQGKAILTFNKKKGEWGWKAFRIN
jgi:hypothetical protein